MRTKRQNNTSWSLRGEKKECTEKKRVKAGENPSGHERPVMGFHMRQSVQSGIVLNL